MKNSIVLAGICAVATIIFPQLAEAYVGPGAGLSAIGAALALVGGLALAIVGFVWYPLKRILARGNQRQPSRRSSGADPMSSGPAKSKSGMRRKR